MLKRLLLLLKLPHPPWHISKIILSMTRVQYDSEGVGHVIYREFYCKKCRKEWRIDMDNGRVTQVYPKDAE